MPSQILEVDAPKSAFRIGTPTPPSIDALYQGYGERSDLDLSHATLSFIGEDLFYREKAPGRSA